MIRHLKIEHVFALALLSLGSVAVFNFARSTILGSDQELANVQELVAPQDVEVAENIDTLEQESSLGESDSRESGFISNVMLEGASKEFLPEGKTHAETNGPSGDSSLTWDSEPTQPLRIEWNSNPADEPLRKASSAVAELQSDSGESNQVAQATLQRKSLLPYRPPTKEPADPFKATETINLDSGNQLELANPENNSVKPLILNHPGFDPTEYDSANDGGQGFQSGELDEDEIATSELPPVQLDPNDNSFEPISGKNKVPARLASTTIKSFAPPTPEPIAPSREPALEPSPKPKKADSDTPRHLLNAGSFVMAGQPKHGDHWKDDRPVTDPCAHQIPLIKDDFSPDPNRSMDIYEPYEQMDIYEGKTLNSNQRPILELGRPWYQLGQLSPGYNFLGKHNQVTPQFLLYGDWRTAIASNKQNGTTTSQLAFEVNLDFDLKITSTERFHMFMSPVDNGVNNTGYIFDDNEFVEEFDADIDFGYFEGDLGAIVGGFIGETLPFDAPFAIGVMPLLFQNGVWMEDAFLGVATTIPARNSPRLGISNMDVTFFAGYDKINSPAFIGDDSAARMYGMAAFIEAMNGYFEIDYAFLDDRTALDRSYHNIGIGFTRRFGRLLSNSTRVIVNAGQQSAVNSADGVLLLSENSLITRSPSTLVPYMNFFAGFDRPQSAARAGVAGGVLRNTGILFETDGMTGYPTLDDSANDTFGGAIGLNLIADDFSQQLIVELAALGVMNEDANRIAPGPQYGVGVRYQLPISNAMIVRLDGMYGFLEDQEDVSGMRLELRHKY